VDQKRACAEAITQAIVEHLNAPRAGTSVVFQEVQRDDWASGGKLMSDSD
jgi:4-oxalocrotonate tautomerase